MRKLIMTICTPLLVLSGCTGKANNLKPVTGFDADRYLGTWYEIARLDNKFERGLDNVTATYSFRDDGKIKVLNQGYKDSSSAPSAATGKAYFVDGLKTGYLKVSFFGPFYAPYKVFDLDKDEYQWAFVSGDDYKYLWLLARRPTISEELKTKFTARVKAEGFAMENLIWVEHDKSIK